MKLIWVIRWKDANGWQYHPETFPSPQKARSVANQLPIAWPIDIVPELRAA